MSESPQTKTKKHVDVKTRTNTLSDDADDEDYMELESDSDFVSNSSRIISPEPRRSPPQSAKVELAGGEYVFEDDQSDQMVDLKLPPVESPPPISIKIKAWLIRWKSPLLVLWLLLMSEAVRGITIPTQANYIEDVRRL